MFRKVLIANRGEIAVRIQRTLRRLGIASVALYSNADRESRHVAGADEAVALGGDAPSESYLNAPAVLAAARERGADAVHPGYGFLSENAAFAESCAAAGVAFIGPTPAQLRDFGLKHTARELARRSAVPLLPGSDLLTDATAAREAAERIGYPVMLKSTAGGGGIGMRLCRDADELGREFQTVRELGRRNFADDGLYLEKFVERARHVEVQIFGDGRGRVLALGERDCSVQRRNQKVVEETPAPGFPDDLRADLYAAAVRLGAAVNYRSAGTVEFVYDEAAGACYFLEVNTRLQVEHGVTENVLGIDLVEWMVRLAAGEIDFLDGYLRARAESHQAPVRHSIQVRLYAEDPAKNFQPGAGLLNHVEFPPETPCDAAGGGVRVDTYIESGSVVSPYYDPLLAKLMVTASSRADALARLDLALEQTRIYGIETNRDYLRAILASDDFCAGRVHTRLLDRFEFQPHTVDVLAPGAQTTVQDYPGRLGYWSVGVPPSGPMDQLSFRLGNRLLDNPEGAPGLEMTVNGASLRFHRPTVVCLSGARMRAVLELPADGGDSVARASTPVPFWTVVPVPAGAILRIGALEHSEPGSGQRSYLSVRHGFDVAEYLGSRSTFALGEFGGHAGRALEVGDVLRLFPCSQADVERLRGRSLPAACQPEFAGPDGVWTIGVLHGPHGAPEFFTERDIETLFTTDYEVHYNSARTGVRLIGPRPEWARPDGGEAGLHPSNIHDNAYAFGTLDFTGDMPIILGPDGPSLGGFVCPATIVRSELWKTGQLRPGDRVRFVARTRAAVRELADEQERLLARTVSGDPALVREHTPSGRPLVVSEAATGSDAILYRRAGAGGAPTAEAEPDMLIRQAGDCFMLVEYGPPVLDINLRFRAHALMQWLQSRPEARRGIVDLTPGIRSLQIQYDPAIVESGALIERVTAAEAELATGHLEAVELATRRVFLPLAWDDPATQIATRKYMQSVWQDAPWCPSNLEFIRRINGLESTEDVRRIVFEAGYLVLGLGDVYLGAPVATPLDPCHRLVTTKYNPARTWTPQNAVGIGGAYLCIYGMEGPGGYQFVGRTCQVWNTYRTTREFSPGRPYLLRFFDEIRFYPVSPEELLDFRADFLSGRASLRIEEHRFRLDEYNAFLRDNAARIADFKSRQQAAFEAERERWRDLPPPAVSEVASDVVTPAALPDYAEAVASPMHGNVWKILVEAGAYVEAGQDLLILEAMKMEVAVQAGVAGVVMEVLCATGAAARPGQHLLVIDTRTVAAC